MAANIFGRLKSLVPKEWMIKFFTVRFGGGEKPKISIEHQEDQIGRIRKKFGMPKWRESND